MAATAGPVPGLSQEPECLPSLPRGHRGPSRWSILCCFTRHVNRELDEKWTQLNQLKPNLVPIQDTGTVGGSSFIMPQCRPLPCLFKKKFLTTLFAMRAVGSGRSRQVGKRVLPSVGSLPKWPQRPYQTQAGHCSWEWKINPRLRVAGTQLLESSLLPSGVCITRKLRPRARGRY